MNNYSRTGLVYDERLSRHYNLWNDDYTEKPERVTQPYSVCQKYELVDRCQRIPCREATEAEMQCKHSPEYVKKLEDTQHKTEEELKELSTLYDYIYFHQCSYENAKLALGGTLDLVSAVLKEEVQNGLAMVRPPGHHAMHQESCGYCHFNNVAIAAQMALDKYGLERILIVDWDVHHGQGTQYMFYDDPRVLYFSVHTYSYGEEWPFLRESDYDYIGEGAGTGFNINVPLNKTGCGNSDYLAIFQQILLPVAYEFAPELVLVSAGYDSAIGCPEGEMEVYPVMYSHFVSLLSALADGKICLIQEGGYCIKTLAESIALSLRALLGDPCPVLEPLDRPDQSIVESILNAIKVLRPYWKCLQYQGNLDSLNMPQMSGIVELPPKPGIKFYTDEKPEKYDLYEPTYDESYHEKEEQLNAKIDLLIQNTALNFAPKKYKLYVLKGASVRERHVTFQHVRNQKSAALGPVLLNDLRKIFVLCIAYDETMLMHKNVDNDAMEERPDRISHCKNYLISQGLWKQCLHVQDRMATEEELTLAHSSDYVHQIQRTAILSEETLEKVQKTFNSVYLCQDTYLAAATAVGSLLEVVDTVLSGKAQAGVALIRPPGHHAAWSHAEGFCIFNNMGIAVKYVKQKYHMKRILIVDWDTHHGDAIQQLFYKDKSVLYISLHRYDNGQYYPYGHNGCSERTGVGEGSGYNVNIAWNNGARMDKDYVAAFQQIVMPIAYQFGPELVFVAAGFDAGAGDLLGSYEVSPVGFAHMTQMLKGLANGKLILSLEGGYTLETTSAGMGACISMLLGNPCPMLTSITPSESAIIDIKRTLQVQKLYWSCFQYAVELPTADQLKELKEKKQQ